MRNCVKQADLGDQLIRNDDGSFSLLGFAWSLLKEMLFWRISPAEVNVLPADGLDSVGTMHAEDYPFLKDLFSLPAGDSEQGK